MQTQLDIVALEEHYADPHLDALLGRTHPAPLQKLLYASAEDRVQRLDTLGIATEVLALAPPGLQGICADNARSLAIEVNDRLAAFIRQAPGRFAGFAALPTFSPDDAARELTRCVQSLGFVGAMIHGPTDGLFLDDPRFEPIFAAAEALEVPLYIHPSEILASVRQRYFAPYDQTHPMFIRAGWGYTIETGTHAMRLILSGVFERHPRLRIILGHFGEGIPFLLDRIDEALARDTPMQAFRELFLRHFYVTSSGFFSTAALNCCLEQMPPERILFSIDAPYAADHSGVDWLKGLALDTPLKQGIAGANARRLLKLT
ncbi:amidohydrolase family protein [Pararhodobacter oceanensis]|uniref:amidohydrolase family protein n=1 Tax=Pararhodobacter oceanensis TaxID=2172121 RepID=UPI003A8EF1B6